jgi:hypothetical protein
MAAEGVATDRKWIEQVRSAVDLWSRIYSSTLNCWAFSVHPRVVDEIAQGVEIHLHRPVVSPFYYVEYIPSSARSDGVLSWCVHQALTRLITIRNRNEQNHVNDQRHLPNDAR